MTMSTDETSTMKWMILIDNSIITDRLEVPFFDYHFQLKSSINDLSTLNTSNHC